MDSKYIFADISKEQAPTRGAVRQAVSEQLPEYEVEAIVDSEDSWDLRLARKDDLRREAEFPFDVKKKKNDESSDEPSSESESDEEESDDEEEDESEGKSEKKDDSKGEKKDDEEDEKVKDPVARIEELLKEIGDAFKQLKEKGDKVDKIHEEVDPMTPGPLNAGEEALEDLVDVGPPAGPATPPAGAPAPKPSGRPDLRRKPGTPTTFSKREVERPATVSMAEAASELQADPRFANYRVAHLSLDETGANYIATLEPRQ